MKKLINIAFGYALAAMAGGVFYREFTKFNGFAGRTALGVVHTHLFLLGCVVFLLLALFSARIPVAEQKGFKTFMVLYNTGLPLMVAMLVVRGVMQVLSVPLSAGLDAAISGVAGIGHILVGVGMVMMFLCLKRAAKE